VKLAGVLDLDTPQFGAESGCTVSKAKLFCVPATKTVVSAEDRATGLPITPLPVAGVPTAEDRVCYKVRCDAVPANQVVTDQFGTRTLERLKASMVCTPAVKGTTYCGDGTINGTEDCEGSNLGGATCQTLGFTAGGTLTCAPGCAFDASGCTCAPASTCGNAVKDGSEQCDGSDLGGATCASLGFTTGGTLACTTGCGYDTSGCACGGGGGLPATGQTTCWNTAGAVIPCAGTGHDGDFQAGATLAYTDNGDGTITDTNTGLMWEKLSDDGSIHDKDTTYTWDNAFAVKVTALNSGSFAGYTDWRVPNAKELQSITNYEHVAPAVSPAFNTACGAGCMTCSCTVTTDPYWSSSTNAGSSTSAWSVNFYYGHVGDWTKTFPFYVRAVRGGS
jgi:hypothetical protein